MKFGERLKLLRYENGSRMPSIDVLMEMATYFRVSTDYLLGMESLEDCEKDKITRRDKKFLELLKDYPYIHHEFVSHPKESLLKIRRCFNKKK